MLILWGVPLVALAVVVFVLGLGIGNTSGYRRALTVLQRYEQAMRDTHGNMPTPSTVLELPGLQAAIRYLMRVQ